MCGTFVHQLIVDFLMPSFTPGGDPYAFYNFTNDAATGLTGNFCLDFSYAEIRRGFRRHDERAIDEGGGRG